jgi:hypothetical protein
MAKFRPIWSHWLKEKKADLKDSEIKVRLHERRKLSEFAFQRVFRKKKFNGRNLVNTNTYGFKFYGLL